MVRLKTGFNKKEYQKGWYQRNKPKMATYMKNYRAEHPEYREKENTKNRLPNGYCAKQKKRTKKITDILLKNLRKKLSNTEMLSVEIKGETSKGMSHSSLEIAKRFFND